jgi:FeS assembly protein IscX
VKLLFSFFLFSLRTTQHSEINTQNSPNVNHYEPPIEWADHEDIAIALYEKFGDDFTEAKIYRIRFTELLEWILTLPNFNGTREQSTEGHLEQIQAKWVYEWRDHQ